MFTQLEMRSLVSLKAAINEGRIDDGIPRVRVFQVEETWIAQLPRVATGSGYTIEEAWDDLHEAVTKYYDHLVLLGDRLSADNKDQRDIAQMFIAGRIPWNSN